MYFILIITNFVFDLNIGYTINLACKNLFS